MGLGDKLRKLVRPGDPGELFQIPDSGQVTSSEVRTSTSVDLPTTTQSASVSLGGSEPPPATAQPSGSGQDSGFEREVRRQMEAQGVDPQMAEQQAEQIEGMLKGLTGGDIPSGASINVQTSEMTSGPFSMFSDLGDLTKAAQNAPFPAFPDQAAGSGAEDPLDKLAKLAELRDNGVLTDAEFAEQKAKLLGET